MQRFTVSLDDELASLFDQFLHRYGYSNRSEAIRDLIRKKLDTCKLEQSGDGHCIGTVTYVYNHKERELANRLTQAQHLHHDMSVSTLHVHLDHDNCLETVVLRGITEQVRAFADTLIARPGVRHGQLYLLPVLFEQNSHSHGLHDDSGHAHSHLHARPTT